MGRACVGSRRRTHLSLRALLNWQQGCRFVFVSAFTTAGGQDRPFARVGEPQPRPRRVIVSRRARIVRYPLLSLNVTTPETISSHAPYIESDDILMLVPILPLSHEASISAGDLPLLPIPCIVFPSLYRTRYTRCRIKVKRAGVGSERKGGGVLDGFSL